MKFTLRDLCWFVVLVACLCAWWQARQLSVEADAWRKRAAFAQRRMAEVGYRVTYYERDEFFGATPDPALEALFDSLEPDRGREIRP